jgi:hypothetical protein
MLLCSGGPSFPCSTARSVLEMIQFQTLHLFPDGNSRRKQGLTSCMEGFLLFPLSRKCLDLIQFCCFSLLEGLTIPSFWRIHSLESNIDKEEQSLLAASHGRNAKSSIFLAHWELIVWDVGAWKHCLRER